MQFTSMLSVQRDGIITQTAYVFPQWHLLAMLLDSCKGRNCDAAWRAGLSQHIDHTTALIRHEHVREKQSGFEGRSPECLRRAFLKICCF